MSATFPNVSDKSDPEEPTPGMAGQEQGMEIAKADARFRNAQARSLEESTTLRTRYALWTFVFMCVWCGVILAAVVLHGTVLMVSGREVPRGLAGTLVASTPVIVGLTGFVLKGLFGREGEKNG